MARRTFQPRTRGKKSETDWFGSAQQTALTAVPASSALLSQVFIPFVTGETVIRIRGLVAIGSDQGAVTEVQLGAYGIAVVSEQAATVGITAVPHPDSDSGWDGWMWHSYFADQFRVATAVGLEARQLTSQIVVDSKAMRKVGGDNRLVFVVENSGGQGIAMYDSFRVLSKVW